MRCSSLTGVGVNEVQNLFVNTQTALSGVCILLLVAFPFHVSWEGLIGKTDEWGLGLGSPSKHIERIYHFYYRFMKQLSVSPRKPRKSRKKTEKGRKQEGKKKEGKKPRKSKKPEKTKKGRKQ